jgi:hypothetical protein
MTWNNSLRRTSQYWRSVGQPAPRIPPGPQSPLNGANGWPNGLVPRLRELQRRTRTRDGRRR